MFFPFSSFYQSVERASREDYRMSTQLDRVEFDNEHPVVFVGVTLTASSGHQCWHQHKHAQVHEHAQQHQNTMYAHLLRRAGSRTPARVLRARHAA
ncbi:hypothetical protein D9619_012466 [Psilocybe cf. subviscida]|uniref:Uncharacterized protein n=1 Tax=Psilocybe cf. subviscida TaxID=2480587 RepID=A0A8H5ARX4_9AGAR|nr:hypothetical protein D9619_012466 [Psilocybe cf. subviscida]